MYAHSYLRLAPALLLVRHSVSGWCGPVRRDFSRPGTPTDNAFVESFNGTLRDECLNVHWFTSLADAEEQIGRRRVEYNESRPHRALGEVPPAEYVRQLSPDAQLTAQQNAEG